MSIRPHHICVICKFCKKTHQTEPQQFWAAFQDTWGRIGTPQTDLQSCTQKLIVPCQSGAEDPWIVNSKQESK